MLVPYMKWQDKLYFLCMRPSNSEFGGYSYQFCKGRIDPGETSRQAALREGNEELGIYPELVKNVKYVNRVMNNTCDLYVCEYNAPSCPSSNDETIHTAYLSEQEFMSIGRDWQKSICTMVVKFINEQEAI